MKGKAVVFTDRLQVIVQEVEIPEPTSTDVVIDVEQSWISIGTESSFLRGERIAGEVMYKPGDPWPFPHVAGYQKVGVVRSVGSDVTEFKPGDRVFASISKVSNLFFSFAGHVSPAVTDQSQVWKLPEGHSATAYAGMVLTQVGFNCGNRPPVIQGDVAVVIGDGLVGQWTAQTLTHRGAAVYVLGRHEQKLKHLPETIRRINTREVSITDVIQDQRVSIIVDTVGAMKTVEDIQSLLKHDGHWVSAGFLGDTGMVDIQSLRGKEITLHTPSGWTRPRMDQTLAGITEGWLITESLITHRYAVSQAAEAWRTILENRHTCLGIVLDW